MPERILHQFTLSPYCIKVRKILDYKRLEYRTEELNPFLRRAVVRISGQKRVPVLVERAGDGRETIVADSTAIAEYLDARYPDPPIYPSDPEARARVALLEDWSDEVFAHSLIPFKILMPGNARRMVALSVRFYPASPVFRALAPFGPFVLRRLASGRLHGRSLDALRAEYDSCLARLDALARGGPFLTGPAPTVFDFAVWGLLRTMEGMDGEEMLAPHAALAAWYARVKAIGPPF